MEKRAWIKIISDSRCTKDVPIRRGSNRTKTKIFVKINVWNILNDIKKEAGSIIGLNERLDFYIDEYDNFINKFSNELALKKYSDITGVKKEFNLLIDSLKDRLKISTANQLGKANVATKENQPNQSSENSIPNDLIIELVSSKKPKDKLYFIATYLKHNENSTYKNALDKANKKENILEPIKVDENDYTKWRQRNRDLEYKIIDYINKNSK